MTLASRIDRWFGKKSRSSGSSRGAATDRVQARRRRAALVLESLEDRVMLTSLTLQVNTVNDVQLGTLLPGYGWDTNNNGEISLRSALGAVNYYGATNHGTLNSITIDVPAGTYALSLGELDLIPDGIAVSIVGPASDPAIITAQQQTRVLEIQAGSAPAPITLEYLGLEFGVAHDSGSIGSSLAAGGAILDNANPLTLQDVTLALNQAVATGSFVAAAGGGLYAVGASVSISSSSIIDNTVTGSAGNQAMGGGLYESGATLTLTNATVNGNITQGGFLNAGGGIYASGGNVSITGSSITHNSVIGGAGAPNNGGANAMGGGLYFNDPSIGPSHSLSVSGSHIDSNVLVGGAAGNSYGTLNIPGSIAPGPGSAGPQGGNAEGGGIFVTRYEGTTSVTIDKSTLNNNQATSGAGGAGARGIFAAIVGQSIQPPVGGTGGYGGLVSGVGLDVTAQNATVMITGSTFASNIGTGGAGSSGGAGGNVGFAASSSVNGYAGGNGGQGGTVEGVGASITTQNLTVSNTLFTGNAGTAGPGGRGGGGGTPSQQANGGAGGNGGGGGNVLGAGLYVPGESYNLTTATLSAVTIQNNQSTAGTGGSGAERHTRCDLQS